MSNTLRAVFVGDGTLLIRCAEAFRQEGHEIAGVASTDPSILEWARGLGIATEQVQGEPQFAGVEFDYLFSVAWLHVLPERLLRRARRLALNFHDGPLPRYAGLNVPAWALMAGETRHAVTWHEMTPEVDAGRILRQTEFALAPDETAFSLNARCYEVGFQSFKEVLQELASGTPAFTDQSGTRGYFGRHARPPALATLDWLRTGAELSALSRGLDFGNYANPLAMCKAWLGEDLVLLVRSVRALDAASPAAPGTVLEVAADRVRVAVAGGEVLLEGCRWPDGSRDLARIETGQVLPPLASAPLALLQERSTRLARGEVAWRPALGAVRDVELPYPQRAAAMEAAGEGAGAAQPLRLPLQVPEQGAATLAAFAAWLCALAGQDAVSLRYADPSLVAQAQGIEAWASPWVPLRLALDARTPVRSVREQADSALAKAREAGPMTVDLRLRTAGAGPLAPLPRLGMGIGAPTPSTQLLLELRAAEPGASLELHLDAAVFAPEVGEQMARHLQAWLAAFAAADGCVGEVPLMPADERARRDAVNDATMVAPRSGSGVHAVIAEAAAVRPDAEALRWHDESLSNEALQARAAALGQQLLQRGVRPGDIVGVCLDRSPDLLVAVLAILRVGAAYLPLDPDYPRDRLRMMVADSGTRVVVCREPMAALLELPAGHVLSPDVPASAPAHQPWPQVSEDAAAYVIYTSGSTGKPKGVVVTHANVLNFFAGMDQRVPGEAGARWLAVTSLSFDISVLELLWTLSRGVTVVLHSAPPARAGASAGPDFSLFYFSSDESAAGNDRYRLLMEGARFADENGFAAVWTPERHFHAFGGLYPNPMLTSAAIAAVTKRIQIRAGSCVLPLHHPARLAEDWALVDNLSHGRVGVSFASGWQPNDFVLAPHAFAERKQALLDGIDTVRRLWRGESVAFPGPDGKPVNVRTLPRPVQSELPVWLTAASNPETFQQAGQKGCHVLTHLLGQTVEDVAQKIALYRAAWREAGHPGEGQVTVMLHTFVGPDEEAVLATAREPMKAYLRSSVDLIRQAAWSFPTFVQRGAADGRTPLEVMQQQPLSDQEMDALLDHAFSRYWNTSALIGTPERCLTMVRRLQDAGVSEIACLIDFGIDTDAVLAHLEPLKRLMQMARRPRATGQALGVAGEMLRQGITHLQCTPSMATMLVADREGREALSRLQALLVGGEALPLALARQLREAVPGTLLNMYGPTETTVWSTCCELAQVGDSVPLGEPIANTRLYVRNAWQQECPALVPGELLIGGRGVTRGYLNRPELTAERFVEDPLHPGERLYRTGDLVRRQPDGRLEFLGRIDHQVKIRGHRIELGEIENALARQPGVREAVVVARQDAAGEAILVGYVTAAPSAPAPDADTLRKALSELLPEIMVPRLVSVRESFPLTPNGKTDRKALAEASPTSAAAPAAALAAPEDPLEQGVAAIWSQVLGVTDVGRDSNFFDLGGHSLLVIQVQRRIKETLGREISITDMFRLPTVAAIAEHLRGNTRDSAVSEGLGRAHARRALRNRAARTA
ncbi:MupA/Atu3671 family FMN-dependent luciferase-like monooxygenase [Ramlibacter sp. AN1015]|uniref:MupA/Atu3671 family FMN-dependent luciferase-like monooxygenase n=1 Tax=Ramlibacter sp. AN1015 TaxID=3133428 RepID=UPI0030C10F7C